MKTTTAIFAILLPTFVVGLSNANWADSDTGDPVINPNPGGQLQSPVFTYNDVDGRIYVNNAGANGIVDSADNRTLAGDDVGLISWLISFPNDPGAGFPSAILPDFIDGIGWPAPTWFNNKLQQTGSVVSGNFLTISDEPIPVMQLPVGLTMDDFTGPNGTIEIEVGLNFADMTPGATIINPDAANPNCGVGGVPPFSIVPEPSSLAIMLPMLVGLLAIVRQRN